MSTLLKIVAAVAIMFAVAAIVFIASRGHVFFLPFILVLGVPLRALLRRALHE